MARAIRERHGEPRIAQRVQVLESALDLRRKAVDRLLTLAPGERGDPTLGVDEKRSHSWQLLIQAEREQPQQCIMQSWPRRPTVYSRGPHWVHVSFCRHRRGSRYVNGRIPVSLIMCPRPGVLDNGAYTQGDHPWMGNWPNFMQN